MVERHRKKTSTLISYLSTSFSTSALFALTRLTQKIHSINITTTTTVFNLEVHNRGS